MESSVYLQKIYHIRNRPFIERKIVLHRIKYLKDFDCKLTVTYLNS